MKRLPQSPRLALPLLLLFAGGCFDVAVHRRSDGRIVPDDWRTAPVRQTTGDASRGRLRFDALYVMDPGPPYGVRSSRGGWERSYYRFWPGGQVLFRFRYGDTPDIPLPTAADGDEFGSTSCGRYRVRGNRLTMTFLGLDENGWEWHDTPARLNGDGSFTIIPTDPGHHRVKRVFHPHAVAGMQRPPDW